MAQEGSHRSCNFVHGGDLFTMFGIFGFYCFLLLPLGEIKMCIVHNRAESMVIAVLMLFAHFVCCCDLRSYGQQSMSWCRWKYLIKIWRTVTYGMCAVLHRPTAYNTGSLW